MAGSNGRIRLRCSHNSDPCRGETGQRCEPVGPPPPSWRGWRRTSRRCAREWRRMRGRSGLRVPRPRLAPSGSRSFGPSGPVAVRTSRIRATGRRAENSTPRGMGWGRLPARPAATRCIHWQRRWLERAVPRRLPGPTLRARLRRRRRKRARRRRSLRTSSPARARSWGRRGSAPGKPRSNLLRPWRRRKAQGLKPVGVWFRSAQDRLARARGRPGGTPRLLGWICCAERRWSASRGAGAPRRAVWHGLTTSHALQQEVAVGRGRGCERRRGADGKARPLGEWRQGQLTSGSRPDGPLRCDPSAAAGAPAVRRKLRGPGRRASGFFPRRRGA